MRTKKERTRFISFSGKGGSGKSTTASLFLLAFIRQGRFKDILVIDADPDANLAETLGMKITKTLGQAVDERKLSLEGKGPISPKLRFSIWDCISNGDGFDFLVMGRTTGAGCYCSVNSALNSVLEETAAMYDLVIVDFDAGLEHFSRTSGNPADTLIVMCDPSRLSFDTARRIKSLIDELSLPYERQYLIGCRFSHDQEALFSQMGEEAAIPVAGIIPTDPVIAIKNLKGESLMTIEQDNPSMQIVNQILERIL